MSDAEYEKDPSSNNKNIKSPSLYTTNESSNNTRKDTQYDRFLSFKACSTYFERFTARLSNYYNVTKNGIQTNYTTSSTGSSNKETNNNTTTSSSTTSTTNSSSNTSSSNSQPNSNVSNHHINSKSNQISTSISTTASSTNSSGNTIITNSSSNLNSNNQINNNSNINLNRNLTARRSSRSNLESSNNKALKMTRDQLSQLSPTVNAQCLSPRPRPKELNMKPSSRDIQQSPIGQINASFVSRTNFIKINGQDYAIDDCDFRYIEQLGAGSCGTVNKMEHIQSRAIVAVKEMTRSSHPEDNKRINMDLEVLLKCNNVEHIVQCYGYLIKGTRVWIIMELMTTCLDKLLKKIKSPFPEAICGKIAVASIKSLDYLKTQHSVIHRDVKPSNILINQNGEIKLCDFGVSGRLVDSYAKTKQGCEAYMAPERILPPDPNKPSYDIRADVWSLGITLVQLALGRYPYQNCKGDFELLTKIIESDPPILPQDSTAFSSYFKDFIKQCLQKEVDKRPKYKYLKWDPFFLKYDRENVDVKSWFNKVYFDQ